MDQAILFACLYAGVPLFTLTSLVLFWLNRKTSHSIDELMVKKSERSKQANDSHHQDFFYKKWVNFGGGFYGMMALFTYLIIEYYDLLALINDFNWETYTLNQLFIDLFVQFVIESIINIVLAIIWPFYWFNKTGPTPVWMSFIAAYCGYWLAIIALKRWLQKQSVISN